jgi:signal transduction histidine kinase
MCHGRNVGRESIPLRDHAARRAAVTVGAVRLTSTVVATLLAAVSDHPLTALLWLVGVASAGGIALAERHTSYVWRLALAAEILGCTVAIPLTGGARSALLPYLLGPFFAIGFRAGARWLSTTGTVVAVLLLTGLRYADVRADSGAYLVSTAEWSVLAVAFGLVASWARVLVGSADPAARYVQVHRLLGELRGVARRLPGSLDPVSAADTLLDECAEVTAFDRAAVLLGSSTERLTPLVVRGCERLDLDTTKTGPGAVGEAWRTGLVAREIGRDVRTGMQSLVVVPIPSEAGPTAVVVLESAAPEAFPQPVVQQLGAIAIAAAPRLESAVLFDEIRRIATVEERQRVAREIHDGIAQELVYVGYELDSLAAEIAAKKPTARDSAKRVREQITRIVSELRLSIFTLRTAAEPGGLGAALGEYVRSVAGAAGIAVHLSLSEDPARLPADAEAELLRIAQEAISNARKHAKARNLWITLQVDPPRALLRVEDDGNGFDASGRRGFGLDIMKERADRLGATLRVSGRAPRGTSVEVELGGAA